VLQCKLQKPKNKKKLQARNLKSTIFIFFVKPGVKKLQKNDRIYHEHITCKYQTLKKKIQKFIHQKGPGQKRSLSFESLLVSQVLRQAPWHRREQGQEGAATCPERQASAQEEAVAIATNTKEETNRVHLLDGLLRPKLPAP
jgi:hypothetical protein